MELLVYYFNDESAPLLIYVDTLSSDPTFLAPQAGILVKVPAKEGRCPFIKRWDTGSILISSLDPKDLLVPSRT